MSQHYSIGFIEGWERLHRGICRGECTGYTSPGQPKRECISSF